MDFHTLSRKQLQTLCKKNKIPANITNVAMADALAALNQVEGLDEYLNPSEGDARTPSVHHSTAGRTSTQRKTVSEEAEGSKVKVSTRPQRGARVAEGVVEQENKDANVPPITPAASRRRATAVSTRKKKEVEMVEEYADKNGVQGKSSDLPKTPAVAPVSRRRTTGRSVCTTKIETPGGTSALRAYNTRRSVRLLEKNLSKMSLIDTEDTGLVKIDDDVSQESSNVSQQVEDLSDTEKGDSLEMEPTVVSEDNQQLEVSSLEKNTEYECLSCYLDSDVKLVSVTESEMAVEPHGSNEAEPVKVNCLELEAEPNASDEAGSETLPVLEESCDSSEHETENKECFGARQDNLPIEASEDAFPEVTTGQDIVAVSVVVPDDVFVDITHQEVASSLPMQSECIMDDQVINEGDDKQVKNNEEDEPNDSNLKLEGSSGTCDKSDDAGSVVIPVLEESVVVMHDILPSETSSEEAPMEVTYQDTHTTTLTVYDAPANIKEFVECNTDDDQGINKDDDNQCMNDETEHLNLADGNMADEDYQHPLNVDEKTADESNSLTGSEGVLERESISYSAGGQQEKELEAKPEQLEAETEKIDSAPDVTSVILALQKDASLENSGTVIEVFPESSANGKESMEVENVTTESSLPVVEADDHKNNSENLEADVQAEESEEPVAGEGVMLEADNTFSSILDGTCSPQIPLVHQKVSVESAGSNMVSGPLDGELSCKSNILVDGDVVSEDAAVTDEEPCLSSQTITEDFIHGQKSTDISVQSIIFDKLKGDMHNMIKENVTSGDDLHNKSIGELKRMLKQLSLNEKSKCKSNAVKVVEKKRTALQVLPQNPMTAGEADIDG